MVTLRCRVIDLDTQKRYLHLSAGKRAAVIGVPVEREHFEELTALLGRDVVLTVAEDGPVQDATATLYGPSERETIDG